MQNIQNYIISMMSMAERRSLSHSFAKASFENARRVLRTTLSTSAGKLTINADATAVENIRGLVLTTPEGGTVQFRDADNAFHEVSRPDLENMLVSATEASQALYQRKWELSTAIDAADTLEELNAIDIGGWFLNS